MGINRVYALAIVGVMAVALTGCKGKKGATEEEAPKLATVLVMSDPRCAQQLLNGFYALEQNQWRWTAGKFSVMLRPPRNAAQQGATLKLKLHIPDVTVEKLKSTTLSGSAGGVALAPETYSKTGDYVYARDIPGSALNGESVRLDFVLSKAVPPGSTDLRELGIIVNMIGLEGK